MSHQQKDDPHRGGRRDWLGSLCLSGVTLLSRVLDGYRLLAPRGVGISEFCGRWQPPGATQGLPGGCLGLAASEFGPPNRHGWEASDMAPTQPPRIAAVTCAEMVGLDDDWALLRAALELAGWDVSVQVWNDPRVDWAGFDVVLVRVAAWAYIHQPASFLAWTSTVEAETILVNPARVLVWAHDKVIYLVDLESAGLPVVPTQWVAPREPWSAPMGEYVIKPTRSAGGFETALYGPEDLDVARDHVSRLQLAGQNVMVQPYLSDIEAKGETAVVYIGGGYSHSVRKAGLLRPGTGVVDGLWERERLSPVDPTPQERQLASDVMAFVQRRVGPTTYARVDLFPGPNGRPVVGEVELVDPSMLFALSPEATSRFVAALAGRVAAEATS